MSLEPQMLTYKITRTSIDHYNENRDPCDDPRLRRHPTPQWDGDDSYVHLIDFANAQEVLDFIHSFKKVVVLQAGHDASFDKVRSFYPTIEIYDGYRE